jgi:hypothetical protein
MPLVHSGHSGHLSFCITHEDNGELEEEWENSRQLQPRENNHLRS